MYLASTMLSVSGGKQKSMCNQNDKQAATTVLVVWGNSLLQAFPFLLLFIYQISFFSCIQFCSSAMTDNLMQDINYLVHLLLRKHVP